MTNEEAKGRLESFIDTFNICKEHDNSLVDVSIGKEDVQAFTQAIKTLEQQPCEDCISRQAVNDGFKKYENSSFAYGCVWDYINKLPPVTPKEKTGHWYIRETYPLECESWECSECKEVVYEKTKYCPNCGARMVSE